MRSLQLFACILVLGVTGCPKPKADDHADAASSATVANVAPDAAAADPNMRSIDGVGDVPIWAHDPKLATCKVSADAKKVLAPFESGSDANAAAGKTDIAALEKQVGADTCSTSVAAGKSDTVVYSFDAACGTLSGKLTWNGTAVDLTEKTCDQL